MDDQPTTQTAPAPTVAIVVPAKWTVLAGSYGLLLVKRIDVEAVDFYPRTAT